MKKTSIYFLKNNFLNIVFSVSFILMLVNPSKATHHAGLEINYQYIGGNQYILTVNNYIDCSSGAPMWPTAIITAISTCGDALSSTLFANPSPSTPLRDVSQLTLSEILNNTCNGGTNPGMRHYQYTDTITLPVCNGGWNFKTTNYDRNVSINSNSLGQLDWSYATLTNAGMLASNNSPKYTAIYPIPYFCVNQKSSYNVDVYDPDGDSLYYSFIAAKGAGEIDLIYTSPYSSTSPIDGVVLDSKTGKMTFTPLLTGNYIINVLIEEFDPITGVKKGSVIRDFEIVVRTCFNKQPTVASGTINNLVTTGSQMSSYNLQLNEGGSFTFDIQVSDPDVTDTVTLVSNIDQVFPGATFVTTPGNPATATISYTDSIRNPKFASFSVTATDGATPVLGLTNFTYGLKIHPKIDAGSDTTICVNQSAPLKAYGGNVFTWSVISGDPIVVGANFSCNPCSNPIATPIVTTTYEVTSDLSSISSKKKDAVTVFVTPDFTYSLTQSDTTVCQSANILIDVVPNPTGVYSYQWTHADFLSNDTIANPIATITTSGSYTYYVAIKKAGGCTKKDSISVTVSTLNAPLFNLSADTNSLPCGGGSAQLDIQIDTIGPPCDYKLKTFDSWGNHWDGAFMDFYVNGVNVGPFTHSGGAKDSLYFSVTQGDSLRIDYSTGSYPFEESFELYDGTNTLVFSDGPAPSTGIVYTGIANCGYTPPVSVTYSWSPVAGLSDSTIANPLASLTTTTTYTALVTNAADGCSNVDDITITVAGGRITPAGPFCVTGDSVTLLAGMPGGVWSGLGITDTILGIFKPTMTGGSGTFYVKYTISGSCSGSDSIPIIIDDTVTAATITPIGPFCDNDTDVGLVSSGTSGGVWSGTGVSGTNFIPVNGVVGSNVVTYTVSSANGGCTDANAIAVVVSASPSPVIVFNSPYLQSGLLGNYTYQWYLNGGVISGATSDTLMPTVSANYTVEVTDLNSCTGMSSIYNHIMASITEETTELNTKIYPNPFTESTTILFDKNLKGDYDVVVYNVLGKEVKRVNKVIGNQIPINKNEIGRGIFLTYLVNNTNRQRVFMGKLVAY